MVLDLNFIPLRNTNKITTMGGKSNFYVEDNCFLSHANYSTSLPCGTMVSAFLEKILIGDCIIDELGQQRFSKKTVIVPNSSFMDFVRVILRANEAFKTNSKEKFEETIYKHSTTHSLIGKFQNWQDEMTFSIFYVWKHGSDKTFLQQCQMGIREPVDVSKLENPEIQPLKRGVFNLKYLDLEALFSQLSTILLYTYFESDKNRRKVVEFIEYAVSEKKHHDYLREQLKDFTGMPVQDKIKIVSNMLKAMFQDQDRADETFEMKLYQDILTNKLALIFSLLSIHLKA